MLTPNRIPGLKIWLDANDTSTINDGRIVTNNVLVEKWTDKASGFVFRSGTGTLGNNQNDTAANNIFKNRGPSYSVGTINGKNSVLFGYFRAPNLLNSPGDANTEDNMSFRRLACSNVTPLSSATYSMYIVQMPEDIRKQPMVGGGEQSQHIINIRSGNRVSGSNQYPGGYQERVFCATSINTGTSPYRNTTLFFIDSTNETTIINGVAPPIGSYLTYEYDQRGGRFPDSKFFTSGPLYQYGKVNIHGFRMQNFLKKFSIMRPDFTQREAFIPRAAYANAWTNRDSRASPSAQIVNPLMTIGAPVPAYGSSYTLVKNIVDGGSVNQGNLCPYEGNFCEFLFWDRVLTDSESNAVEMYLQKKWIG